MIIVGLGILFLAGYVYMFMLMCTACTMIIIILSIVTSLGIMFLFFLQIPAELNERVEKYCPIDQVKDL